MLGAGLVLVHFLPLALHLVPANWSSALSPSYSSCRDSTGLPTPTSPTPILPTYSPKGTFCLRKPPSAAYIIYARAYRITIMACL